jgi:hypothetical protein
MARRAPQQSKFLVIASLLVTGLGIGWLTGLSASPVVSIVITSLTGSAAAIVAVLSGLKDEPDDDGALEKDKPSPLRWQVDPAPVALLVIGLLLGALAGIWIRTHNWLSPPPAPPSLSLADQVAQWVQLGLPQDEVVRRLFEDSVSTQSSSPFTAPVTREPTTQDSVLFATASPDECKVWSDLLAKQEYDQLAIEVSSSAVKPFQKLPEIVMDNTKLAQIVETVLCVDMQP